MSLKNNEQLNDEDFSSEDMEVYKPSNKTEDLEVDERAYNLLEHIDLDWPSQTLAFKNNLLFLATNPEKGVPSLIKINLEDTDFKKLSFEKTSVDQVINRLRLNTTIICVSDDKIVVYSDELKPIKSKCGNYGYGLWVDSENIIASTTDGFVEVFDSNLELISRFKLHKSSIESIAVYNRLIYTASTDSMVKITDFLGVTHQIYENNGVEVNCLDIVSDKLVFGDDEGIITLIDINAQKMEKIAWHTSSIEMVKWKDSEIFASCSEEQLCLWDITMEDNWEFSKYLLFVHQGQYFYKDIVFSDNIVITTTQDGVSMFEPVSFGMNLSLEDANSNE